GRAFQLHSEGGKGADGGAGAAGTTGVAAGGGSTTEAAGGSGSVGTAAGGRATGLSTTGPAARGEPDGVSRRPRPSCPGLRRSSCAPMSPPSSGRATPNPKSHGHISMSQPSRPKTDK